MVSKTIMLLLLLLVSFLSGATNRVVTLEPIMETGFEENSVSIKIVEGEDQEHRGILSFLFWIKEKVKKKVYNWLEINKSDDENNINLFWWWSSLFLISTVLFIIAFGNSGIPLSGLATMIGVGGIIVFLVWLVKIIL